MSFFHIFFLYYIQLPVTATISISIIFVLVTYTVGQVPNDLHRWDYPFFLIFHFILFLYTVLLVSFFHIFFLYYIQLPATATISISIIFVLVTYTVGQVPNDLHRWDYPFFLIFHFILFLYTVLLVSFFHIFFLYYIQLPATATISISIIFVLVTYTVGQVQNS